MSSPAFDPRTFLRELFDTAVNAVSAQQCLPDYLPSPPKNGRTVVIGAGKAAAAMAKVVEEQWAGQAIDGLVVTRYGHGADCRQIEVIEAAHPVPDAAGQAAAARILEKVQGLSENDLVLCLISGGGSALLSAPAPGITLEQKQAINKTLLRSGASIFEINCVRKHLSAIKGGRLALACAPAKVVTLLISDIPGDDPGIIASGPTLPDPTTCAEALAILQKYAITVPDEVIQYLQCGFTVEETQTLLQKHALKLPNNLIQELQSSKTHEQAQAILQKYTLNVPDNIIQHLQSGAGETPKPGDPRFARNEHHIIATAQDALVAAAAHARAAGITAYILGDDLEGEARETGWVHAFLALQVAGCGNTQDFQPLSNHHNKLGWFPAGQLYLHLAQLLTQYPQPLRKPCVLLSGGETTVTVRGNGRGGRNAEFLLGLADRLQGAQGIDALACDTDGIDGSEDNAGAIYGPDSWQRAQALGLNARALLDNNDAYGFFSALDDLIFTGPTRTNVNDFRAILIR